MIRDYYLPRWKHYFEERKTGVRFDFADWEKSWVESGTCSSVSVPKDVVNLARSLVDYAAFITLDLIPDNKKNLIGAWTIASQKTETVSVTLPVDKLESLAAFRIEQTRGRGELICSKFELVADGKVIWREELPKPLSNKKKRLVYPVRLTDEVQGNNGVEFRFQIQNTGKETVSGQIYAD